MRPITHLLSATVIGTLDAPDYAQYVSHTHPDGQVRTLATTCAPGSHPPRQVHFNVFSAPRAGATWGAFSEDTDLSPVLAGGPLYGEVSTASISANKVSEVGRGPKWDSVLLARLRFKPDVLEPTSL